MFGCEPPQLQTAGWNELRIKGIGQPAFQKIDDAECPDGLGSFRHCDLRRQHRRGQWVSMVRLAIYLFLLMVLLCGCKSGSAPASLHSQPDATKNADLRDPGPPIIPTLERSFAELKLKLEQGSYEEVISGAEAAYLRTRESQPIWAWKFRLLQARATSRSLDYEAARDLLNIKPPAGLPVEEFVRKNIIVGESFCASDPSRDGINVLESVKPLLPLPSVEPVLNAEWLYFRGRCEHFTTEAARYYFELAGKLARGKDKWLEVASSGMLAYRLMLLDRFDEALDRYKPALSLSREIGATVLEERMLDYMAQSYYRLGEFQKGKQYAILAEKLAKELNRIDHRARILIDIGVDEQSRGSLAEASENYFQALALAQRISDKSIRDDVTARCLNNLTMIELQRQSLEKAEEYHNQAAPLKMRDDDRLTWDLSHVDLALARKDFPAAQSDLTRLSAEEKQTFRALWSVQERTARMYELMGNLQEAEKWYRATINTAIAHSEQLKQEYKTSILSNFDFFSNYIEFLLRNNRSEQALQIAEIGRARALAAKVDHSLPQEETGTWLRKIQMGLKKSGKVVLAYWESKTRLYVWLVTATEVKLVQQPYGMHELEKMVIGYQNDIAQHSGVEGSPSSRRLYEILVQPFESQIPKGSHVIIVAHGNLYEINFESLIVPQLEAHYWIEDVWLENAIYVSHMANSSKGQVHYKKEMLAIGAAIQVDADYPTLPNAGEELERVTRFFQPGLKQIFRAESATPRAFFTSNPEFYRYIHFVAHGTNIPLEPMDSAIILSPDQDNSYKLYARDLANLKHPIHAEVVTISSCNSAGASTNDLGGPVGLSSAFLHAGAHQVVAALWKIDDAATPQLMDQFYSELAKGKTASEALHDAKLSMLHDKRHRNPFYWATLQLYSET